MSPKNFGPLRSFFWPVYKNELRKLIPLMLLCFLVTFNYNMLRNSKDALIVTAKLSGAEVIPFIKVWVLLPMAIGMTYLFTQLSNRFSRKFVFYWMVSIFLAFFLVFVFVIFPLNERAHLHSFADFLQEKLPMGMWGMVAMLRYWSFTLYYVMSELWGAAILSVSFWAFVNEITKISEAKRFYSLIALSANLAAIASGFFGIFLSRNANKILGSSYGGDKWHQALVLITLSVLVVGVLCLFIYQRLYTDLLHSEDAEYHKKAQAAKVKMSMKENFCLLAKDSYLRNIAIVVIAYNVISNLVGVIWRDQIRQLHPNPDDFHAFMSHVSILIGVLAIIGAFASGVLIRKYGWTFTAMLTPVIILVTSVFFFSTLIFKEDLDFIKDFSGMTPLMFVVVFGSIQNIFMRGSKFTLFDNTKELAFVPLKREVKLKGKAAIDGVGSRLGKSGGSIVYQSLLIIFGSVASSAPIILAVVCIAGVLWICAVKVLGKQFAELTKETKLVDE